jgi:nucleoside-diphosphate-sugar epimerase
MLLAADQPHALGRIYHIADGARTTIGELVGALAESLDCPPPQARVIPLGLARLLCGVGVWLGRLRLRRWEPLISPAALRFLGTSRFVDIRRAREELGYSPRIGYREGVADTVRWLEAHAHDSTPFAHSAL